MAVYRDDVEALNARHAALSHELAAKTREVADATRLLDEARTRAKLPVLDNIRVATPCSADWAKMTGDDRARACADCNKSVYNISDLTRDEAQALIIEKEGKLCVRYFQRADGTILLKDCSIGVGRKRKRRLIAAGAAALLAGVGGWIVLAKRAEPESHCMSQQLPDQEVGRQSQVKVTGHESVAMPHHDKYATMGDMEF
jgi:hypothetical protein